jgi:hypothetical protein
MRHSTTTSGALIVAVAALAWLTVAAVITAAPVLTRSGEQGPPDVASSAAPAPTTAARAQERVVRFRPALALHADAAADVPGGLRLRISSTGTFLPTAAEPARLRLVLTAPRVSGSAVLDRMVRRLTLTDAAVSAVFRHLRPGTWRWRVGGDPGWTLALVGRASGRVDVAAPAPPQPPPAPAAGAGTAEDATGSPAPDDPSYDAGPTTPSTPAGSPGSGGGDPAPPQGGGGGPGNQPAAPFGGGAPTPEGPHAP